MAKRRGNNEGSIHQLPSGSWRAQITLDGFRLSHTATLRRDCQEWLKKTIGQIDEGMNYDSTKVTLEDFLSSWINSSKTRLRPRTFTQYTQLSRQYIFPHLGMIKIRDLRPEQIQKMYDKLLSQEVGVYTVLKIHAILSAALEYALRLSVVSRNPATLAMPPQKPAMEMKILDEGQVSQLLIAAQGSRLEGLLQLTLSTGIREMELLGLKWTDLDWVKRKLVREGGPEGIRTPDLLSAMDIRQGEFDHLHAICLLSPIYGGSDLLRTAYVGVESLFFPRFPGYFLHLHRFAHDMREEWRSASLIYEEVRFWAIAEVLLE